MRDKSVISAYSARIENELSARDGKLMVVDPDASAVASALAPLLRAESGFVVIAPDPDIAGDLVAAIGGEVTLVSSRDGFIGLLAEIDADGATDTALRKKAAAFRERFPRLVVAFEDDGGKPVFNGVLAEDTSAYGRRAASQKNAPFCASDMLSVCNYPFIVVDDPYSLFGFIEEAGTEYDPAEYDMIDLMGTRFFTDVAHSFRRLNVLTSDARKCVVISPTVIEKSAVELYGAITLLHEEALGRCRNTLRKLHHDYLYYCDDTVSDMLNLFDSQESISLLMRDIRGIDQIAPAGMDGMTTYIDKRISYFSDEELYLRAVACHIEKKFGGKTVDLLTAIGSLVDYPENMAEVLKELFFADEVKCLFERGLAHARDRDAAGNPVKIDNALENLYACRMSDSEIDSILSIFDRYGIRDDYSFKGDVRMLELYRDESGFEAYTLFADRRYREENGIEEEGVPTVEVSTIYKGADLMYTCAAIAQCLEGGNSRLKCSYPALIVTREKIARVADILRDLLPDVTVTGDFSKVSGLAGGSKTVVVADYDRVRACARPMSVASAALIGLPADPVKTQALIGKLVGQNISVTVTVGHSDLGSISAKKQWRALSGEAILPIGVSEFEPKRGKRENYTKAIKRVDEAFNLLVRIASGEAEGMAPAFMNELNALIKTYTLNSQISEYDGCFDLDFLGRLAPALSDVFANCVSVGADGETVDVDTQRFTYADEEKRIFFNACKKLLRRTCDGRSFECKTCDLYRKFKANDLAVFENSLMRFYDIADAYSKKLVEERDLIAAQGKINLGQAEDTTFLSRQLFKSLKSASMTALKGITKKAWDRSAFLSCDHGYIDTVKEAALEVLRTAADDYYMALRGLFDALAGAIKVRRATV